jgi:hypothetical protein
MSVPSVNASKPPVIASGAKQSSDATPFWIASPTATMLPQVRNDGILHSRNVRPLSLRAERSNPAGNASHGLLRRR